ncbi:MAG: ferredoxin-thioredoxin reductase catalytic domain-containing protein [Candidatus Altiarchaeota archaeon]
MTPEELKMVWGAFTAENDFKLNEDAEHVDMIVKGVLENEGKHGLKLCPCRLRDGSREMDLSLICPCNFRAHDTWKTKGMCWCGLFVKK